MVADPWPLNPEGELLLGLKIEDRHCLPNVDAIAAIPGIGFAEWGPGDMGMSMGFPDGPGHPAVRSLITEIFDRVRGAGLIPGTVAGSAEEAQDVVQRGGRIILGSVQGLLKLGAGSFLAGRG